jgi:hypothetical protein
VISFHQCQCCCPDPALAYFDVIWPGDLSGQRGSSEQRARARVAAGECLLDREQDQEGSERPAVLDGGQGGEPGVSCIGSLIDVRLSIHTSSAGGATHPPGHCAPTLA